MRGILTTCLVVATLSLTARAQMVEVQDDPPAAQPAVGRERAAGYMKDRKATTRATTADANGPAPRYLDVHIGGFFDSQGYKWGDGDQGSIGKFIAGIDYRLGEWTNSADLLMRIDFQTYGLDEGSARKLTIGGIITFPDSNSRFPLYFGAGLGAGFFLKQIHNESALALDYSILAGARFLNVFDQLGFMVETGLKDHLHLFSDGQFNGIYVNIGTVWLF